jgi:hypothetical protein
MARRHHAGGPLCWCKLMLWTHFSRKQRRYDRGVRCAVVAFAAICASPLVGESLPTATPTLTPVVTPTLTEKTPPMQGEVPQGILEAILAEAAKLAKVAREKLVIVRAESVVWNNGALGCPQPGMMYTDALVNGYWVVIDAGGKRYDFRVGGGGSFRLCPEGRGQPPLQPGAT